MNKIHLNQNDFWRYPLDRALLKPLLKDELQTVHYEKKTKIWKLNGVAVQLENKKIYSKIAGFVLFLFHKIRLCCNATYQKKFQAAKLKIEHALLEKPLTPEQVRQLKPLFIALEADIRSYDFPDAEKWWISKIGEILGNDQIEERVEELRPIFKKLDKLEPKTKIQPFVLS